MSDTVALDKSALTRMRERTREARKGMAEKLFSSAAIEAAMSEAAKAGHTKVMIEPTPPVDLKDTPAATAACEYLKAAGFEVKWERKGRPELGLEWWVLVVEWSERKQV